MWGENEEKGMSRERGGEAGGLAGMVCWLVVSRTWIAGDTMLISRGWRVGGRESGRFEGHLLGRPGIWGRGRRMCGCSHGECADIEDFAHVIYL